MEQLLALEVNIYVIENLELGLRVDSFSLDGWKNTHGLENMVATFSIVRLGSRKKLFYNDKIT